MQKRFSISQARANLPAIVDKAESGQVVEVTRRGRPVVAVISLQELKRLRSGRTPFAAAYRGFLDRHSLAEIGVDTVLDRMVEIGATAVSLTPGVFLPRERRDAEHVAAP